MKRNLRRRPLRIHIEGELRVYDLEKELALAFREDLKLRAVP